MFIKITKTHHRALDPRTVETFYINDIHEFEEELARNFIKSGFAVEYKELKQKIENKAILELPEVKEEAEKEEIFKTIQEEDSSSREVVAEPKEESIEPQVKKSRGRKKKN